MKGVFKIRPAALLALAIIPAALLFSSDSSADTIKVPAQYREIQAAIDKAKPGDTVLVSAGRYMEDIRLKEDMVLQGEGADVTIIEGSGNASVVEGAKGAVIEGFTITGSGRKGTIGVTMDAAISCNNAPMTIANNRIINNNTGIKLYYSPSNIINNEIAGSKAYGVYLVYSDSLVQNNVITKSASHGIYNSYANPEIINNTIEGNFTGVFSEVSRVVVRNNIVTGNFGSGIRWAEFVTAQYRTEPILSHNVVWGNGEDYINIGGHATDINSDPVFADGKKGDFRLKKGSPASGKGEGGVDIGAFGGRYAQARIPVAPKDKSYAGLSLKERLATIKEPDYMSQSNFMTASPLEKAKGDFNGFCVPCHGAQGKGDGLLADTLDVRPRDLSDKSIMSYRTDEMLFKVIKDGGPAGGFSENMMSFSAQFNDEEIKNIIQYLRSEICNCSFEGGK